MNKKKWVLLGVGAALMLIPRRSSRQAPDASTHPAQQGDRHDNENHNNRNHHKKY